MNRRQFLVLAGAALASRRLVFAADDVPRDIRITRITAFDLPTKRVKFVGKNARLDDHGDGSRDRVVFIKASDGTEGFGCCHANEKVLAPLLGQSPGVAVGPQAHVRLGAGAAPIWDLLGKMQKKPVYELLGGAKSKSDQIQVYDGSIYFSDLIPKYAERWPDRFKEELDDVFARGHRAFKAKIGRGNKWMPRDEGDARDIDVLKLLRAHAGKDVKIAVDANNGYGLDRTKKLLDALPDFNFDFIEEMFPEVIEQDLELKSFLRERGLKTLVADGETQPNVEPLKPFMTAKAIDLYQLDVNAVGVDGLVEEARLAGENGLAIAPHTWGTLCGFYAQLHVARAIPNFYSGEQDPLSSPLIGTSNYRIKDGVAIVPDAPGFGLKLDRSGLEKVKPIFDLRA